MTRGRRSLLRRWVIMLSKKRRVRRRIALFRPILPGASLRDRLAACGGALLGIAATGGICYGLPLHATPAPALIAPIGASAVLLFAVPASPLAQPWPIIGGNTLSALVGVLVATLIPDPVAAGAVAVAAAIAAMSLARCLHPPGGAAALTVVLGGPAVAAAGLGFVLFPVAVNSILLVGAGWLFHRVSGHSYPHVPRRTGTTTPPPPTGVTMTDVDEAIEAFGETLDVSRDDLGALVTEAEVRAMERLHAGLACRDLMSVGVDALAADSPAGKARAALIGHGLHSLPVVDGDGVVTGAVGHAQLADIQLADIRYAGGDTRVGDVAVPALLERPDTPVMRLLDDFSDGRTFEAWIVDEAGALLGVVTQTDLLRVLARPAAHPGAAHPAAPAPLPSP